MLGDDNWRATVLKDLQTLPVTISLEQLVEQICQQHHVTAGDLESSSQNHFHASIRAKIGLAAADNRIATLTAVAHRFKRSPSTLSHAVENLRRKKTHKSVPGTKFYCAMRSLPLFRSAVKHKKRPLIAAFFYLRPQRSKQNAS
ncbi:hypothetical protein N9985_02680 [Gammaproteobacteria bacterium]|nr:hypothetical protein [Gammaproteobacteria bacterium]